MAHLQGRLVSRLGLAGRLRAEIVKRVGLVGRPRAKKPTYTKGHYL
jgi:hypothetical protein